MAFRPPRPRRPAGPPPRDPIPGSRINLSVIALGIGIYLVTLLFGVTVVGDTARRSAVMAGVILAIAATGYLVNNRNKPPRRPTS